jgi:hypothetical protein
MQQPFNIAPWNTWASTSGEASCWLAEMQL